MSKKISRMSEAVLLPLPRMMMMRQWALSLFSLSSRHQPRGLLQHQCQKTEINCCLNEYECTYYKKNVREGDHQNTTQRLGQRDIKHINNNMPLFRDMHNCSGLAFCEWFSVLTRIWNWAGWCNCSSSNLTIHWNAHIIPFIKKEWKLLITSQMKRCFVGEAVVKWNGPRINTKTLTYNDDNKNLGCMHSLASQSWFVSVLCVCVQSWGSDMGSLMIILIRQKRKCRGRAYFLNHTHIIVHIFGEWICFWSTMGYCPPKYNDEWLNLVLTGYGPSHHHHSEHETHSSNILRVLSKP